MCELFPLLLEEGWREAPGGCSPLLSEEGWPRQRGGGARAAGGGGVFPPPSRGGGGRVGGRGGQRVDTLMPLRLNNRVALKLRRRELRSSLTPAEARLWTALQHRNLDGRKFRRP